MDTANRGTGILLLLGRVSPPSLMGAAYPGMFFFAFGLGSASAAIAGYIADSFSLEASFWKGDYYTFTTIKRCENMKKTMKK